MRIGLFRDTNEHEAIRAYGSSVDIGLFVHKKPPEEQIELRSVLHNIQYHTIQPTAVLKGYDSLVFTRLPLQQAFVSEICLTVDNTPSVSLDDVACRLTIFNTASDDYVARIGWLDWSHSCMTSAYADKGFLNDALHYFFQDEGVLFTATDFPLLRYLDSTTGFVTRVPNELKPEVTFATRYRKGLEVQYVVHPAQRVTIFSLNRS